VRYIPEWAPLDLVLNRGASSPGQPPWPPMEREVFEALP